MSQEMLDYFDSDMKYLGTADREVVHENGWWHQTFHCWVIRSSGQILFQRRSRYKAEHAGLLDITAAGHLLSGESIMDGVRELEEEIGVRADFEKLINLGLRINAEMLGMKINHEFSHEYFVLDDRDLDEFVLQPEEVEGIFAADINDAIRFFAGQDDVLAMQGVKLSDNNQMKQVDIHVRPVDVVSRIGPYYLTVCLMAQRFLAGETILSI